MKKHNIAFKCTYNDNNGGNRKVIGYRGRCSNEAISYNMKKGAVWCTQEQCSCRKYYNSEFSIDPEEEYPCYESRMLINWDAYAGIDHSGENAGRVRTIRNAQKGKIGLYTTRLPEEPEVNRVIFGVFLIAEVNQLDDDFSGNLKAHESLRIELSQNELLYFWDYFSNANSPDNFQWGSGLFRYLDDTIAAQILVDVEKTASRKNRKIARNILERFCSEAGLDCDRLIAPNGYRIRHGFISNKSKFTKVRRWISRVI